MTLSSVQTECEALERENKSLKDQLKTFSKKSLLGDLTRAGGQSGIASLVLGNATGA